MDNRTDMCDTCIEFVARMEKAEAERDRLAEEVERLRKMVADQAEEMCDFCGMECGKPCDRKARYDAAGRGEEEQP